MGVTAIPGPAINYGVTLSSSGALADYNDERGPSLNDLGEGTLDPRPQFCYKPGNRPGTEVFGWPGCFGGPAVDFMPIALNTSGIAAAQSASAASGTVTLTTSATSSSFRSISGFVPSTVPVSNPSSITVLMIDGYQGGVAVGQGSSSPILGAGCGFGTPNPAFPVAGPAGVGSSLNTTINIWSPLIMGGRCFSIGNSSNTSTGAQFVFNGFDVYGMAMTCTLVGPTSAGGASSQVSTLKAMKYIQSITWTGAGGGSIFIGTIDTFGFPLYVDSFGYAQCIVGPSTGATLATGSSLHTFGYGSSLYGVVPPTYAGISLGASIAALSSGGDVRGTYASSAATTGNTAASGSTGFRVVMNISPRVLNLATVGINSSGVTGATNVWGLVGLPQV